MADTVLLCEQLAVYLKQELGLNVLVDDRGEKTIGWKVKNNRAIGVPNVVALGRGLLETQPKFELITCDGQSQLLTHAQLIHHLRTSTISD